MDKYKEAILLKDKNFVHFLPEILEGCSDGIMSVSIDDIKVKRVDENLLARVPFSIEYGANGKMDDMYWVIAGVEKICLDYSYRDEGEDKEYEADNIGQQIFVRKLCPDYIVHLRTDEEGYDRNVSVVIYKAGKFDLAEYHCQQIDRAAAQFKAEIRTACAGGGR